MKDKIRIKPKDDWPNVITQDGKARGMISWGHGDGITQSETHGF